jgi:hypothetical protein
MKKKKSPKRVRFPSCDDALVRGVITIPHRDDYTPEEVEALYFSRDEYQACRNAAKASSWECERKGHGKCLDGTFCEKDSDVQERLNSWVVSSAVVAAGAPVSGADSAPQLSCCRRGLERWSNSDHGEIRNHAQFHAIMAVLRAQDDQLVRRKELDWDKLRKVSCKVTKTSRHFARMIGKADSYAVWQDLKLQHVSGESSTSIALSPQHSSKAHEQEQDQDVADLSLQGLSLEQEDIVDGASLASIATKDEDMRQQDKALAPNNPRVGGRIFNFKRRKEAFASRVA